MVASNKYAEFPGFFFRFGLVVECVCAGESGIREERREKFMNNLNLLEFLCADDNRLWLGSYIFKRGHAQTEREL